MHQAVKEAIEADGYLQDDPVQALLKITSAQMKLATGAQIVGGMSNLQTLSGGLPTTTINNTMTCHERQMRTVLLQKGFMKKHPLSEYTLEAILAHRDQEFQPPLSPSSLLPPLKID